MGYEIIAEKKGEKLLFYEEFGSYQGEFLMVTESGGYINLYKDSYGSCTGCDALEHFEMEVGWDKEPSQEDWEKFCEGYDPFLSIPIDTIRNIDAEMFKTLLPKNWHEYLRNGYDDMNEIEVNNLANKVFDSIKEPHGR